MIEDDVYRTSTQYRYWSYTPQQLAETRKQTNELASEKVRAAFRRSSKVSNGDAAGEKDDIRGGDAADEDEMELDDVVVDTLTVEEELKIVEWGCGKIIEMGEAMRPRVPGGVVVWYISFPLSLRINHQTTYHTVKTVSPFSGSKQPESPQLI
jgi:cyclin H